MEKVLLDLFASVPINKLMNKRSKKANTNKLVPATQKQPQQLQSGATKVQHMPQIPEPR